MDIASARMNLYKAACIFYSISVSILSISIFSPAAVSAVQHMLQSSERIINSSSYKLLQVNDSVSLYLKLIPLDIVGQLEGLADKLEPG